MLKRAMDIGIAFVALLITLPVQLLVALGVKVTSNGPVLYRGLRVGLNGRSFFMFKFRTMVTGADKLGGPSTAADDVRLTRFGSFLRKYKLDELPQLLNVILGDMSLVGPRPEVPRYIAMLSDSERKILSVRPGITDYASLKFRNEGDILRGSPDPEQAYLELIRPEKVRLAMKYVETHSAWGDLKILGLTARRVLSRGTR